jgi:hypothetical protein
MDSSSRYVLGLHGCFQDFDVFWLDDKMGEPAPRYDLSPELAQVYLFLGGHAFSLGSVKALVLATCTNALCLVGIATSQNGV